MRPGDLEPGVCFRLANEQTVRTIDAVFPRLRCVWAESDEGPRIVDFRDLKTATKARARVSQYNKG